MRRDGPMLWGIVGASCLALVACSPLPLGPTESPSPATSTVTVTVTASPSPSPSSTATATSADGGCTNGTTEIPAGADTATIGDVDQDGRDDTAFYAAPASGDAEYGIRTAAGGVYTVPDGLAGPGTHSGWTAALDASPGFVTLLDDGRQANLFVFHDCRWVRTIGPDGKPYVFGLNGYYEAGTGVACNDRNGGTLLEGVLAVQRDDGLYDIRWTQIDVSADGRTATNGATETRWSGLRASDQRLRASMESRCGDAPVVSTGGD